MCEAVASLDDEETAQVAGYYADLPRLPSKEQFDAALAARGEELHASRCAMCHLAPDSADAESGLGIPLHGQRQEYILFAIDAYMRGNRLMLWDAMAGEIRALEAADLSALVNYYASYRER